MISLNEILSQELFYFSLVVLFCKKRKDEKIEYSKEKTQSLSTAFDRRLRHHGLILVDPADRSDHPIGDALCGRVPLDGLSLECCRHLMA